jgi:hypothetical protein
MRQANLHDDMRFHRRFEEGLHAYAPELSATRCREVAAAYGSRQMKQFGELQEIVALMMPEVQRVMTVKGLEEKR